jgi:hypothetical protein
MLLWSNLHVVLVKPTGAVVDHSMVDSDFWFGWVCDVSDRRVFGWRCFEWLYNEQWGNNNNKDQHTTAA